MMVFDVNKIPRSLGMTNKQTKNILTDFCTAMVVLCVVYFYILSLLGILVSAVDRDSIFFVLSGSQVRRILNRKKYVYIWAKYSLENKWYKKKRKAFKKKLKEYIRITLTYFRRNGPLLFPLTIDVSDRTPVTLGEVRSWAVSH